MNKKRWHYSQELRHFEDGLHFLKKKSETERRRRTYLYQAVERDSVGGRGGGAPLTAFK